MSFSPKESLRQFFVRIKAVVNVKDLSSEAAARSIAFALGSVFLPFHGIHTPFIVAICFVTRMNFPVVYTINWINNPVTLPAIIGASYWVGTLLTEPFGLSADPIDFTQLNLETLEWSTLGDFYIIMAIGSVPFLVLIPIIAYFPVLKLIRRMKNESAST